MEQNPFHTICIRRNGKDVPPMGMAYEISLDGRPLNHVTGINIDQQGPHFTEITLKLCAFVDCGNGVPLNDKGAIFCNGTLVRRIREFFQVGRVKRDLASEEKPLK